LVATYRSREREVKQALIQSKLHCRHVKFKEIQIYSYDKTRPETMQEEVQARLEVLKQEFEKGQAELQKVEAQRTYLHETVLRIAGAIQALEQLLTDGQPAGQAPPAPSEKQPATSRADEAGI